MIRDGWGRIGRLHIGIVVVEVVIRHVVRVVVIVVVSGRTALVKHGRTARRGREACRAASAHLLRRRARR